MLKHILLTIGIQHPGDVQVLLGYIKCSIEIFQRIILAELVVVNKIRTMTMNQCTEGETILERQMEVLYVHILVRCGLTLAPEQQTFLGGHLFHGDVLDGEPEDDGPDHTQCHLQVTINDLWNVTQYS